MNPVFVIQNKITDITVTNELSPGGGTNSETTAEAKIKGPRSTKALTRTIAREDYIYNSESVEGVIRAQALSLDESPEIPNKTTYVYIVPNGGGAPGQPLKDSVLTMLTVTKPIPVTWNVYAFDAEYKTVDISGTFETKSGYVPSEVKTAVDQALIDYFDYLNIDPITHEYTMQFEMKIELSFLIALIQNVEGVKGVDLTDPTDDVQCTIKQIPELGDTSGLIAV